MWSRSRNSASVKGLLAGYDLSPPMFLLWVNVILLVLGCLLEGSTILLVIVPIFMPTAKALGIDPVHFGVVVGVQHHDRADYAALRPAAVHHRGDFGGPVTAHHP